MAEFSQHIIPIPQPDAQEIFQVYETTQQFYREVQHREELDRYCEWYYQVASEHQRDLVKMRNEINFFGWVCRANGRGY